LKIKVSVLLVLVLLVPLPSVLGNAQRASTHPRLFFTSKDLKMLRSKTMVLQNLWDLVRSSADESLTEQPPQVFDRDSAEAAIYPAQSLAFAFLVTGKEQYARKALAFVHAVTEWSDWIDPSEGIVDLGTSWTTLGVSIVYDWLHDYMNETENALVRTAISQKGAFPIFKAATISGDSGWPYAGWWRDRFHNNHAIIAYGALGVAALALLGEVPEAETWLDLARHRIVNVLDSGGENGGWGEGIHYWQYGMYPLVFFVDALRRVTGEDLYQNSFLREMLYFPLYSLSRGGKGFLTFCDSFYSPKTPTPTLHRDIGALVARLASEYRDPYGQWLVDTLLKEVRWLWKGPWAFIWYDPSLLPRDPVDLPLVRHFVGLGWVIMRTGWSIGDIMFAFKSGPIWNHGHADQNSFILEASGERLVDDLGYGDPVHNPDYFGGEPLDYHIASVSHNTILVNGKGQVDPREYWSQLDKKRPPYVGGTIQELVRLIGPSGVDSVLGDATKAYSGLLTGFRRQVVFVRPRYFVIVDQLSATTGSMFEWLLHTIGDISVDGDVIHVRKGNVTLDAKVLTPKEFDFEILRDQQISEVWGEKPSTVAPYIKIRPRSRLTSCQFVVVLYPHMSGESSPPFQRVETRDGFDLVASLDGGNQTIGFKQVGNQMYLDHVVLNASAFSLRRNMQGKIVEASMQGAAALQYDDNAEISFTFLQDMLTKAERELSQSKRAVASLGEAKALYTAAMDSDKLGDHAAAVDDIERSIQILRTAYSDEGSYVNVLKEIEQARQAISRAELEGRTQDLQQATFILQSASKALDEYQYENALLQARTALDLADRATVPTTATASLLSVSANWAQIAWPYMIPLVTALVLVGILVARRRRRIE
jgi:hypothetical protein